MWCLMRFEKLTKRIALQRVTVARDATSNEAIRHVAESFEVWAEAKSLSVGGKGEVRSLTGDVLTNLMQFTIRYFPRLDATNWQIRTADKKIWDIVDMPEEIGRKQGMYVRAQWSGRIEDAGVIDLLSMLTGGVTGGE